MIGDKLKNKKAGLSNMLKHGSVIKFDLNSKRKKGGKLKGEKSKKKKRSKNYNLGMIHRIGGK